MYFIGAVMLAPGMDVRQCNTILAEDCSPENCNPMLFSLYLQHNQLWSHVYDLYEFAP